MEQKKIAYYPGCSLESSSSSFEISMKKVFAKMDIAYSTLKDWTCCGATSAHAVDHEFYLALNLRNLALAEEQGFDEILAPCAACYHRLVSANLAFTSDPDLLKKLNSKTGLNYKATVKVRNILDFLVNVVGNEKIASHVTNPLGSLKPVNYYGCLNTRIPRLEPFDSVDYPMTMDRVCESLGAKTLDWAYKTECCGASLFLSVESVSAKLVSKILNDAISREADCIVVSCPLCQNNLDTKQKDIIAQYGLSREIPVIFITQLMGLAFGLSEKEMELKQNFIPFEMKV